MLDEAGFDRTRILGSSDLDEWLIESIKKQGAEIDIWGVGTRLVTSYSCPALGGVYKLSAIFENGQMQPKLKVSDDPEKTTNPGVKKVVRFYDEKNFMRGDVMFFEDEILPPRPTPSGLSPHARPRSQNLSRAISKEKRSWCPSSRGESWSTKTHSAGNSGQNLTEPSIPSPAGT